LIFRHHCLFFFVSLFCSLRQFRFVCTAQNQHESSGTSNSSTINFICFLAFKGNIANLKERTQAGSRRFNAAIVTCCIFNSNAKVVMKATTIFNDDIFRCTLLHPARPAANSRMILSAKYKKNVVDSSCVRFLFVLFGPEGEYQSRKYHL
jgi:hypothetical protein